MKGARAKQQPKINFALEELLSLPVMKAAGSKTSPCKNCGGFAPSHLRTTLRLNGWPESRSMQRSKLHLCSASAAHAICAATALSKCTQ